MAMDGSGHASTVSTDTQFTMLRRLQTNGLKARWAIKKRELDFAFGNEPIASGSGGDIFKIKWRGITCCAKRLEGVDVTSQERLEDFGNEIRVLSVMRHPHLILFLGAVFDSSPPMLIMEYAPGGTLLNYLQQNKQIGQKLKFRFISELALGMNFLHNCNPPVIHRDLKPSNVLLDQHRNIKITDFGLARFQSSKNIKFQDEYRDAVETGSYRYMAPEVFLRREYDEKVDVYSYALVTYFILSGTRPFHNCQNPITAVQAACDGERPPVEGLKPTILKDLVVAGWNDDPELRPSFEAIVEQVQELDDKGKSCVLS